jgi:hypothetical protein
MHVVKLRHCVDQYRMAALRRFVLNRGTAYMKERKKERSFIFSTTTYIISIIFKWSNTRELVYSEMV